MAPLRLPLAVDRLDVAILRSLYGPWPGSAGIPGAWDVARRVGAHGTTVKRRLARLRRDGVLRCVRLAPAPSALAARPTLAWLTFADAPAKLRGLAALEAAPEVMEIHDFVGPEAAAWVYAFDPEQPSQALARIGAGAGVATALAVQEWAPQQPAPRLSPLDARIVAALVPDAHRPAGAVARACGVTPRTVRARLRALAAAGAFTTYPAVGFAEVTGAVAFVLLAEVDPREGRGAHAAFLRAFPDHVCASAGGPLAFAYLVAASSAQAAEALDRAATLPGIARPRVLLVRDLRTFPGKVVARLAAAGAAPRAAAQAASPRNRRVRA